jgi:amino acid transporter
VGPVGLAASVVNVVIGGGIFALPAALARGLGSAAPLAFLVGVLVMTLVTVAIARAGSRVAQSGGVSAYAAAAFGPLAGFLSGVLFALAGLLSSAAVAAALVDSLATLAPALSRPPARGALLLGFYTLVTAVNLRGVREGTALAGIMAAIKFGALLAFVVVGVTLVRAEHLAVTLPAPEALGRGVILAIFALAGVELALGASGEVREPGRTIPRALFLAIALIASLYLAIQIVAQGVLGAGLALSTAPLADAISEAGVSGGILMLAAGAVSMFGWLAGNVLGVSRQIYVFGQHGFLPRALGAVHPRFRVPHVALGTYATASCLLALTGTFAGLAILASVSVTLLYLGCCTSAWALTRGSTTRAWAVPGAAIAGLLWVLSSATAPELFAVGGVLLGATGLYAATARRRSAGYPHG